MTLARRVRYYFLSRFEPSRSEANFRVLTASRRPREVVFFGVMRCGM